MILSGYLRWMGWQARSHAPSATAIDIEQLALRAGVARAGAGGTLEAPYLTRGFRLGVVTTDDALAPDAPLDPAAPLTPDDPAIRDGAMGTRPLWWDEKQAERPLYLGRYPMERIPRRDEPSTLLLHDEIRRIPKRGNFFKHPQAGDLGDKPRRERMRFPM